MLMAIIGGAVVGDLTLGIPFVTFLLRIQEVVPTHDLWVGLIKAPVFAIVVAAIGCRQGMSVAGDVESLGRRVTAAVVQAIFAIIFLDAVFAMIFMELDL